MRTGSLRLVARAPIRQKVHFSADSAPHQTDSVAALASPALFSYEQLSSQVHAYVITRLHAELDGESPRASCVTDGGASSRASRKPAGLDE